MSFLSRAKDPGFARGRRNPGFLVASLLGMTMDWPAYAIFFSTSAEFFDPNPTQLQIACSI